MRPLRLAILAIAAALILVPTLARARQRVELRDATRLSIKHSWLGVAPPTKAIIAPTTIAVLPAPVVERRPAGADAWALAPLVVSLPGAVLDSSDPLRGPPSPIL
jgi:integral membrane sensor domain MASE1